MLYMEAQKNESVKNNKKCNDNSHIDPSFNINAFTIFPHPGKNAH